MVLYIYRLTDDSGFAPCVDNNLLSLACCKGGKIRNNNVIETGLRHRIGTFREADYRTEDVYILGVYRNKMLYLARVTNVVTMNEYFSGMSKGRTDDIYKLDNNALVRNRKLRNKNIHTEQGRIIRDIAGKFVVLSDDYIYLGKDALEIVDINKYYPMGHGTKVYKDEVAEEIVNVCKKYQDGKRHIPNVPIYEHGGCK